MKKKNENEMKQTKNLIMLAFLVFTMSACGSAAPQAVSEDTPSLSLGDIVLSDGSVVKEADYKAIDDDNVPIAVIAGWKEDGTAFGIGVHRSDTPLQWTEGEKENHPALTFADTYGESYELSGEYAFGWSCRILSSFVRSIKTEKPSMFLCRKSAVLTARQP